MNCPLNISPTSAGVSKDLGEKTQLIINAALDAIIGIDTNGDIIIWNPQAEAIFGWQRHEIIGKSLTNTIIPERFRHKHDHGMRLYLETGQHTTLNRKMEVSAINRQQREFPIELSILPIKEDGHEFFCAFIRDISDRKAAEQSLLQAKLFSDSVINSLPGIFYLFDKDGHYMLWNRDHEVITGYSGAEIKKIHPLDFFEGAEKERVYEKIKEVFEKGEAALEAVLISKTGDRIPLYLTGKYIEVEGKPCLMGMGIDISERLQLQRQLDEKTRKLQKQMTTAVIMAQEKERAQLGRELHDNVNQVLTTIKLYNEMLRDSMGDPETLVERSIAYLQECINEIRSISKRLSAPTLGEISLPDSIKELIESIHLTNRLGIDYHTYELGGLHISQEIHLAIYRIVQEQVNNILKHAEASKATIRLEKQAEGLLLHISDDGKGFNVQSKALGIGLKNMQTRAENLGGIFTIKSLPGTGTELKVLVPL